MANEIEIVVKSRDDTQTRFQRIRDRVKGMGSDALTAAKNFKVFGGQVSESTRRMASDVDRLTKQITGINSEIVKFTQELVNVDKDSDAFKRLTQKIADSKKEVGRLSGLRKTLSDSMRDAGDEGASWFSLQFSSKVGPLLARAPISPHIIAAAAGAAPFVASAVSGAVTLGLTGGAVALGIVGAIKDPKVAAAGKGLGAELGTILRESTRSFVPATLDGISKIRAGVRGMQKDLTEIEDEASKFVGPFIDMGLGFVRNLLPGIKKAVQEAGPLVDVLGRHLPKLGDALGGAFTKMAEQSENAASSVQAIMIGLEGSVGMAGTMISELAKIEPIVRGPFMDFALQLDNETVPMIHRMSGGIDDLGASAEDAAEQMAELKRRTEEYAQAQQDAFSAETNFGKALDEANDKIYKNHAGVDAMTEKGRRNREMLQTLAQATLEQAKRTLALTHSSHDAEAAMRTGYNAFIRTATGMGMSTAAAKKLAAQLGLLPPSKTIPVKITGTSLAAQQISYIRGKLASIRDKSVRVSVRFMSSGDLHVEGGRITQRQVGGISGGLTMVGERGPELLQLPQGSRVYNNGTTERMMRAGGGAGGTPPGGPLELLVMPGSGSGSKLIDALVEMLRFEVRTKAGGNVQTFLGKDR